MAKTFRNVYFWNKIPKFNGSAYLFYTGHVFTMISKNQEMLSSFDRDRDILLKCPCDSHNFKGIVQVKKKK